MMETATVTPEPQRLRALERANEVRLARADLKRRIAVREISAAEIILSCPAEAETWAVNDVLMSQRRWGRTRCQKFLARNHISEVKTVGTLTDRQRRMLAEQLECAAALAEIEAKIAAERAGVRPGTMECVAPLESAVLTETEIVSSERFALAGVA